MMGMDEATSARGRSRLECCKTIGPRPERALRAMAKAKKPKQPKKSAPGRVGAEQWLAVRLKTGAGPMEPTPRRGTRAERERAALELENGGRDGKEL
jgi:hypothetical protein